MIENLKAPMVGASDPASQVEFRFVKPIVGGRLILVMGQYSREFLTKDQPFTASRREWETYLSRSGRFQEVSPKAIGDLTDEYPTELPV